MAFGILKQEKKIWKLLTSCKALKNYGKRKHKFWTRYIFTPERRYLKGHSDNLIIEMRLHDQERFFNYLRMTPAMFDHLLSIVGPKITKLNLSRESISAKTRLEITIRYLSDGPSMTSLSYDFRVEKNTVSQIISTTCQVIWDSLKEIVFLKVTEENWKKISEEYNALWNFKNCIGSIDGKHIVMQAPPNSGSTYYNYKGCHSINLLAIADAKSCFIMVDIGAQGRLSDSGIFKSSIIGHGFENNLLNLPKPTKIPQTDFKLPFVLVGDEAFALSKYLMRPYPRSGILNQSKKIFNYRLSRARRMVESAFGILVARWRVFRRPIIASIPTVIKIVQASVCLHNFVMQKEYSLPNSRRRYSNLSREDQHVPTFGLEDITRAGSNTYSKNVAEVKNQFATYFEKIDPIEIQWNKILTNDF